MDFEEALEACLEANLKIVCLVLIGGALTFSGKLDQRGVSDLGAITYYVALPSLIFTNVASSFKPEDVGELWIFPVSAVVYILVAFGIAKILCIMLKVNKDERNAVIAAMMFGNTGSLAIAIIASLCRAAKMGALVPRSVSYIALFIIGQNLVMFSWGEYLLSDHQPTVPTVDDFGDNEQEFERDYDENNFDDDDHDEEDSKAHANVKLKASSHSNLNEQMPVVTESSEEEQDQEQEEEEEEEKKLFVRVRDPPPYNNYGATTTTTTTTTTTPPNYNRARRNSQPAIRLRRESSLSTMDIKRVLSRVALDTQALVDENLISDSTPAVPTTPNTPPTAERLAEDLFDKDYQQHVARDLSKSSSLTSLIMKKPSLMERLEGVVLVVKRVISSPPLVAALLGLFVAMIPPLQGFLFGPEAPLRALTGALVSVGRMQVPASMLMLSGAGMIRMMEQLKPESGGDSSSSFRFSSEARLILLFGRCTTMGLVGFAWYRLCVSAQIIPPTGLLPFILFLEAIVPSAQNVVMLLLVHGDVAQGRAMAVAILEQYLVTIPFLTLYLVYFLVLTKPFEV